MKTSILFFVLCLISHEITAQSTAFAVCPANIPKKLATPLKSQKLHQVVRAKKEDLGKCYTLDVVAVGEKMQIGQSLSYDSIELKHKYVATGSVNGTWDVKMNSKLWGLLQIMS